MSLDASVYCNCFELGKLHNPPPVEFNVYLSTDGGLGSRSDDLDTLMAFDAWLIDACEHKEMTLVDHRIGNIALVGLLRSELSKHSDDFPVILAKVVYNGIHSGDLLSIADIHNLEEEMLRLKSFQCDHSKSQPFIDNFFTQMTELVECALSVNKPILF